MAIGGSVRAFSIAGRLFAVAADADVAVKLGGRSNETQPNGDSTVRRIQSVEPWSAEGMVLVLDDARGDQEFLQNLADGGADEPITFTYASGETYQGVGNIDGEMPRSSQNATGTLKFSGPGKLTKQ